MNSPPSGRCLAWAAVGSALEEESGDAHAVVEHTGGALIAVVDGLGHGSEAARASETAVRVLRAHPAEPVHLLIERCHERLHGTRGAAMSIASIDAVSSRLEWVGVGNVEALLFRSRPGVEPPSQGIAARGGVVGYQLPPLRPSGLSVEPGDTLVMATDGIRRSFAEGLRWQDAPDRVAAGILTDHARGTDDALVLVARFLGEGGSSECESNRADRAARSRDGTLDPSHTIPIREELDVPIARQAVRARAARLGLRHEAIEALATAVSEVARNMILHAGGGELRLGQVQESGRRGILVVARDEGPGIADLERALEDGFSTTGGLGLGLPGARRLVDDLRLDSRPGRGTTVSLRMFVR